MNLKIQYLLRYCVKANIFKNDEIKMLWLVTDTAFIVKLKVRTF